MKKSNQLNNLKKPVEDVWQVRLIQNTWSEIKEEAKKRKSTYSWVSRYCIFRLVNQLGILEDDKRESLLADCQNELELNEEPLHRLQICFYGEDIVLIRTAAISCGLSVSMFIRIALKMFLPKLQNNQVSRSVYFWYGIKMISKAVVNLTAIKARSYSWYWVWRGFSMHDFYKMPPPVYHLSCDRYD